MVEARHCVNVRLNAGLDWAPMSTNRMAAVPQRKPGSGGLPECRRREGGIRGTCRDDAAGCAFLISLSGQAAHKFPSWAIWAATCRNGNRSVACPTVGSAVRRGVNLGDPRASGLCGRSVLSPKSVQLLRSIELLLRVRLDLLGLHLVKLHQRRAWVVNSVATVAPLTHRWTGVQQGTKR